MLPTSGVTGTANMRSNKEENGGRHIASAIGATLVIVTTLSISMCLCFYAFVLCILCFIDIVIIVSYHGWPARWITPFWQPAYPFSPSIPTFRRHLKTHYFQSAYANP